MKKTVLYLILPLLALFGVVAATSIAQSARQSAPTGTLETLIVANGTVAMDVDLNRLNGGGSEAAAALRFQAAPNSFFPIVVFNGELRGAQLGSIGLVATNSARLPGALNDSFNQLVVEKVAAGGRFELVVRDGKTGFVFFNIEGHSFDYDAAARSFRIADGRLLLSEEFADSLGRRADAGATVGSISVAANMRPTEVSKVVNGEVESVVMPSAPEGFVPGPDVIVGDLPSMAQFGSSGTQVGLGVGTTSCNAGEVPLNWYAMPNTDHPVIPQNLYRMSGGADNSERFVQIGQSWLKHAFTALQQNACGFGCTATGGTTLGRGCSDPYDAGLNASQGGLGHRAWVNPFTGSYPNTARTHTNHAHNGISHRLIVEQNDLNTTMNPGASYFAEAQYVTPHEYAWCQSHPGQCNMYNNVSYRPFGVVGTTSFTFPTIAGKATVREQRAISAWTGATINTIEPAPGVDGRGAVAYKVSGPVGGVYHYEYAIFNENLDRSIQSFSVPLGCGVTISNVGFHAPLNHPGTTFDGTVNNAGFSNAPWTQNQTVSSMTWSSETFASNPNANAIRWGTMYNFRFDSTRAPQAANATIGFYKTGAPITVAVQAPTPDACAPLQLNSAVSRKTHGAAGTFDINMPLPPTAPGVECRSGANGHAIVVTFSNPVVSGNAAVTSGTGSVSGSPTFSGNTMTVNLTGVPTVQQLTVTLSGVTDSFAQTYPDTALVIKALFGDIGGNSGVSSSDIAQVKSEAGNPVTQTNFRADVTAEGAVSSSDIGAVKSMAGATLP